MPRSHPTDEQREGLEQLALALARKTGEPVYCWHDPATNSGMIGQYEQETGHGGPPTKSAYVLAVCHPNGIVS